MSFIGQYLQFSYWFNNPNQMVIMFLFLATLKSSQDIAQGRHRTLPKLLPLLGHPLSAGAVLLLPPMNIYSLIYIIQSKASKWE